MSKQETNCVPKFKVGDSASFSKTVTESDISQFAGITGDFNPVHMNIVAAEESRFGKRVAHGALLTGFISAVIGMQLPGPGTIYLSQDLKFCKPVYLGDTVTATVSVEELLEKGRVRLHASCTNQDGKIVGEGTSTVMYPQ